MANYIRIISVKPVRQEKIFTRAFFDLVKFSV